MINKHLNTIVNMDCLEFMKQLPDKCVDLVLTDPPYGLKRHERGSLRIDKTETKGLLWDIKPTEDYFNEIFRISKNQIIWGLTILHCQKVNTF